MKTGQTIRFQLFYWYIRWPLGKPWALTVIFRRRDREVAA